jgi:hypothetical protein
MHNIKSRTHLLGFLLLIALPNIAWGHDGGGLIVIPLLAAPGIILGLILTMIIIYRVKKGGNKFGVLRGFVLFLVFAVIGSYISFNIILQLANNQREANINHSYAIQKAMCGPDIDQLPTLLKKNADPLKYEFFVSKFMDCLFEKSSSNFEKWDTAERTQRFYLVMNALKSEAEWAYCPVLIEMHRSLNVDFLRTLAKHQLPFDMQCTNGSKETFASWKVALYPYDIIAIPDESQKQRTEYLQTLKELGIDIDKK